MNKNTSKKHFCIYWMLSEECELFMIQMKQTTKFDKKNIQVNSVLKND